MGATTIVRMVPKNQAMCPVGTVKSSVGRGWYDKKKGTFCAHCLVAYNFDETYRIYLLNVRAGMRHGIPRCMYCGRSLRTRPKKRHVNGFFQRLKEIKGEV